MKTTLILITLFLIISCNSPTGFHQKEPNSLQNLLSKIRDSIKKYPNDPGPKFNLVSVLQDGGLYKEALLALDSVNIFKGDSAKPKLYFDYLFKRAELLELNGDTTEAIKTFELFVIPGELTQAGLQLTKLYAETKNPKAISFSNAMMKNDKTGKDPNPDYLKGIYYYNIEDYKNALAQFDSCMLKDYTFLEAYLKKGNIFFNQNKFTQAIKVYDLMLSISHANAEAFLGKAKCQEALGQMQEAKLNYQRANGLDKSLIEAKKAAERIMN